MSEYLISFYFILLIVIQGMSIDKFSVKPLAAFNLSRLGLVEGNEIVKIYGSNKCLECSYEREHGKRIGRGI